LALQDEVELVVMVEWELEGFVVGSGDDFGEALGGVSGVSGFGSGSGLGFGWPWKGFGRPPCGIWRGGRGGITGGPGGEGGAIAGGSGGGGGGCTSGCPGGGFLGCGTGTGTGIGKTVWEVVNEVLFSDFGVEWGVVITGGSGASVFLDGEPGERVWLGRIGKLVLPTIRSDLEMKIGIEPIVAVVPLVRRVPSILMAMEDPTLMVWPRVTMTVWAEVDPEKELARAKKRSGRETMMR
jgi:hypothetical protein